MPSPKALVIATLKELTRQAVKEKLHLSMVSQTRRAMEEEEAMTKRKIVELNRRIARELTANARLLGVKSEEQPEGDGDLEGEDWKT